MEIKYYNIPRRIQNTVELLISDNNGGRYGVISVAPILYDDIPLHDWTAKETAWLRDNHDIMYDDLYEVSQDGWPIGYAVVHNRENI